MKTLLKGRPVDYTEPDCCAECRFYYSDGASSFCFVEHGDMPYGLDHTYGKPGRGLLKWMWKNKVEPHGVCSSFEQA